MLPFDADFNKLPYTRNTILRGCAGVAQHPLRQFNHHKYHITFDELIKHVNTAIITGQPKCPKPNIGYTVDAFDLHAIKLPNNYTAQTNVDSNCPLSLLYAIPMSADGCKQDFNV